MKHLVRLFLAITAIFVLCIVTLDGCGGSSSGGGDSSLNVFATDAPVLDYTGVWVKIYSATLKSSTGQTVQVVNSPEGMTVNLRALNDGAAKFLFLAPAQLPDGTYTSIDFDLDKSVTLIATGSGAVTAGTFADSLDASVSGHTALSVNLTPAVTVPGTTQLVVDFDLQAWVVVGTVVTPVARRHDGSGLGDINRHERYVFSGVVGGLTGDAPDQSLSLSLRTGGTVTVTTDESTSISSSGDVTDLANGQSVDIAGTFDPATNSILAKLVWIKVNPAITALAFGHASAGDAIAGTFSLDAAFAKGFEPQGSSVNIVLTGTTFLRNGHMGAVTKQEFFDQLASYGDNAIVQTGGTYDASSNTLTASFVCIENEEDLGLDEARGNKSSVDATAGTFDLTVTQSAGFTPPSGAMHVAVGADARYRNRLGHLITKTEFFDLLAATTFQVKVRGTYAGEVFTATSLQLKP